MYSVFWLPSLPYPYLCLCIIEVLVLRVIIKTNNNLESFLCVSVIVDPSDLVPDSSWFVWRKPWLMVLMQFKSYTIKLPVGCNIDNSNSVYFPGVLNKTLWKCSLGCPYDRLDKIKCPLVLSLSLISAQPSPIYFIMLQICSFQFISN